MAEELAGEEEFLEDSSIEELKLILEGFPFCAALVDEDHRVVYANEGLRSTLGNAFDDLLSRHGETRNAVESGHSSCPVCKSIEKGHSAVSLELRSDEGNAALNIALFPLNIRTERGRRLFLCIGWDTSKEHAGNGLHQTADTGDEKYRAIFQNTPNMVGILTCEGVFVDANPVMLECFGQNIVGRNIAEVTPEDVSGRLLHHISCAVDECRRVTFEFSCGDRHYLMSAVPVGLMGKRHCLLIGRDVTELKNREILLEALIRVERLIDTEKDRRSLLEKVCRVLASLPGYVLARIDLTGEFRLNVLAGEVSNAEADAFCKVMEHVMTGESPAFTTVRECTGNCRTKRRLGDSGIWVSSFPLKAEKSAGTLTVYHSRVLSREELEILETISADISFALRAFELEEIRVLTHKRIEDVIYRLAYLTDEIKNALMVISGIAELRVQGEESSKILRQVDRIKKILEEIDRGWIESEKLKKFLKKYT